MPTDPWRRDEFSASTARQIYLNHAGISPAPARVVAAIRDAAEELASDPHGFSDSIGPTLRRARAGLARLMGAPAHDLGFTRNTGHALAIVADGLDLQDGDNVVSVDCDYPAVTYPWTAQSWRGIETRLVTARPDGSFTPDDLAAAIDSRTRVLALSWVQFGTGFRIDLARYRQFARDRGLLFVVDVIQGLGALPLDCASLELDVAATGSHKWLLTPPGIGGLYVAPRFMDRLRPTNIAAASVTNWYDYDSRTFRLRKSATRYEEGSPNLIGVRALEVALSLIEEIGIERIGRRVRELTDHAAWRLTERGYQVFSLDDPHSRSSILAFVHPDHPNERLLEALTRNNVVAAIRGGRVRLSPHFYNTVDEIEAAIDALPE